MGRKQFIKVKVGLAREAKHRRKLGDAWQLFLFMLDCADWDTGIVYEWKDADAAEVLEMPLPTLRWQRRHLENEGYIQTTQRRYNLEILIQNWTNPRDSASWNGDKPQSQGDNPLSPSSQGDNQGYNEGDNQGDNALTLLHITQKIRESEDQNPRQLLYIPETPLAAGNHPYIMLYNLLTGIMPGASNYQPIIQNIHYFIRKNEGDVKATYKYLEQYWNQWLNSKSKSGKSYNRMNLAWLEDWAVSGNLPSGGGEKELPSGEDVLL